MMPPCGTFDYVGIVPADFHLTQQMSMTLYEPITPTGDDLMDKRLVGYTPSLKFIEAGITPEVPPEKRQPMKVERTQLVLTRTVASEGTRSGASFHIDRSITTRLLPGDLINLARMGCGGLGISVLRNGELIVAAGAVTAVVLGDDLRISYPWEEMDEAALCLQKLDPEFCFPECPLVISGGGKTLVRFRGNCSLGDYVIWVGHGFYDGEPGTAESVGIIRNGACPALAARSTAQFLEYEGLVMYD